MTLSIYTKYKVKIKREFTVLSEENVTKYDNIFETHIHKDILIFNGGILLDEICKCLKDNYINEFVIVGNEIHLEFFNYNNGESESICYEILEEL